MSAVFENGIFRQQYTANGGHPVPGRVQVDEGGNVHTFVKRGDQWIHEYVRDMGGLRPGSGVVADEALVERLESVS